MTSPIWVQNILNTIKEKKLTIIQNLCMPKEVALE
jgi:hypothetical protein